MRDLLSTDSADSIMNIVMQFRKVCNHPEIFERRGVVSPFVFCAPLPFGAAISSAASAAPGFGQHHLTVVAPRASNPIALRLPRLLFEDVGLGCDHDHPRAQALPLPQSSRHSVSAAHKSSLIRRMFSVWHAQHVHESRAFAFHRLVDLSPSEVSFVALSDGDLVRAWLLHLVAVHRCAHRYAQWQSVRNGGGAADAADAADAARISRDDHHDEAMAVAVTATTTRSNVNINIHRVHAPTALCNLTEGARVWYPLVVDTSSRVAQWQQRINAVQFHSPSMFCAHETVATTMSCVSHSIYFSLSRPLVAAFLQVRSPIRYQCTCRPIDSPPSGSSPCFPRLKYLRSRVSMCECGANMPAA
jgi:hypothetical protein